MSQTFLDRQGQVVPGGNGAKKDLEGRRRGNRCAVPAKPGKYRLVPVQDQGTVLENAVADPALGAPDELPPQSRRLLELIHAWVGGQCRRHGVEQRCFRFTRRQVREAVGWGNTQLKVHLRRLEEMKLLRTTWIVVTSDHGEGLGDHGEPTHAFFLYDSTVKVPLIVKGPGVQGSRTCRTQVRSMDLKDLILALALTEEAPPGVRDLRAYLVNGGPEPSPRPAFSESLYCYRSFRWAQMTSLRTGQGQLIRGAREEGTGLEDQMDRFKSKASRSIEQGPLFQLDLPGYFGSNARGGGLFLDETENRKLPHPPDEAARISKILDAVEQDVASQGLDAIDDRLMGDYARFRRFELAAALNRLRSLRVQ